ncbi:MAG: threonine--tRNA ligase [Planctomycetes bacterium]|nr:threonine--tRNA ligase [Planctomycetota bacterium]
MGKITLPDGSVMDYADGQTVGDIAEKIGRKLAKDAVAGKIDGKLVDLTHPLAGNVELSIITRNSDEGLEILRHSTSHVMAQAVKRLFPNAKFDIGPAIEDGFYYDFDLERSLTEEDLKTIEEEMHRIVEEDIPVRRREIPPADALREMEEAGQDYKVDRLREIKDDRVSFYDQKDFTDFCRGPHVPSTGKLGVFKLRNVAGAYFRGDHRRKMLQRIYGFAFNTRKELEDHEKLLEEAKKRDHRTLSKDLELFSVSEQIGPGLILWHPRLGMVRHLIEDFWRQEHLKAGYQIVYSPHIASGKIYERSGHLENYAEMMYSPMDIDGEPYYIKPMNCPGHIMMYNVKPRSYRDLPIRMCELGTVYRYEPSGTLHGMLRVRGFTQDDSHIFCTPEQLSGEIAGILRLVDVMMTSFGYTYRAFLATRPEKSLGSDKEWETATTALKTALEQYGLDYEIDEGGGVFYAPKIDIKLADSLGREWQGPTIQVDLNLPKRFNVAYVGADNQEHETLMIHRTVLGSMERFIGGLIEHFGGAFPMWLAPVQVRVIPITDSHHAYAAEVERTLRDKGLRVEADLRSETVGLKIREATLEKVPYMLVLGDREASSQTVAVRHRKEGDLGSQTLSDFIKSAQQEIAEKR